MKEGRDNPIYKEIGSFKLILKSAAGESVTHYKNNSRKQQAPASSNSVTLQRFSVEIILRVRCWPVFYGPCLIKSP